MGDINRRWVIIDLARVSGWQGYIMGVIRSMQVTLQAC